MNALEEASVKHVAIFCYGMKARGMTHDLLGVVPDVTVKTRRVDIRRNYSSERIHLFKLNEWATQNNGRVCLYLV